MRSLRTGAAAVLAALLYAPAVLAADPPSWLPAVVHTKQWEVLGLLGGISLTAFLLRRFAPENRKRIRPAVIVFLLYVGALALAPTSRR
jgi:hypothetical protein